ncbi:TerB family tellurite resistance protein [Deltaproteobacteria bacterium TL4]
MQKDSNVANRTLQVIKKLNIQKRLKQHKIKPVTYLRLMNGMIRADGILHPGEAEVFIQMAEGLNLSDAEMATIQQEFQHRFSLEKVLEEVELPSSEAALRTLLEGIWPVALADGELHPKEVEYFDKLEQHFGIQIKRTCLVI